jgi:FkbM family methyltransferase
MNEFERSLMTISCRDCDSIPKVQGAGQVIERNGERLQRMHNGLEVIYGGYYGDWMAHIIRGLQGHHEPQEEAIFSRLLRYVRHNTRMVELGCFWAYYTCWFLKEIPDSTALCIEPDPQNLAVGRRNLELNGLAARARTVNAWIGPQAQEHHEVYTETGVLAAIPVLDGPAVIAMAEGPIELLHLDIQGAELALLQSIAPELAADRLRFIMISTHHSSISGSAYTHVDCIDRLRSMGATILVEHDVIESFSGDGMILASFCSADRNLSFPEISRNRAETSLFSTN